jgi:hypothetical protein
MLTMRLIGVNYSVREDGQSIGRIRLARERTLSIWLWNVTRHSVTPRASVGKGKVHSSTSMGRNWQSV